MKPLFAALFLVFLCTGCASVKLNGGETKITKIDTPEINQTVTAYVGDYLLQKGEVVEEKILRVNKIIDGVYYDIPQGTYPQIGHDEKYDYYSSVGVVAAALADPHRALRVGKPEAAEICVITIYSGIACYKGDFEKKDKVSERGTTFQQTLIYSGRIGNKINIGYREFSNNYARPAFNNDVEYDLSASKIIGYKGAQIEVINADNNSITYKVIRSFP